jgi:hypothetical protein
LSGLWTHRLARTRAARSIAPRLSSRNRSAIAPRWHRRTRRRWSRRRGCRGSSGSRFSCGRLHTGLRWTNSRWNALWRARKRLSRGRSRGGGRNGSRCRRSRSRCWSRRCWRFSRSGCSRCCGCWLRDSGRQRGCRRRRRARYRRGRSRGLCCSRGRGRNRFWRYGRWRNNRRSGRLHHGLWRLWRGRRGFWFRSPLKDAANFFRDFYRDGTRVRLFLGYTKSRQQVDDRLRLDLQLSGQFVNSDL